MRALAGFDLPWTRLGTRDRGGAQEIKLARDAFELLDLAVFGLGEKLKLIPWDDRSDDDFPWHRSPYMIGECWAEILVVTDNADSLVQTVRFNADMQHAGWAECELSKPIEDAPVDSVQDLTG
jgi:hypothetical protein